MIIDRQIDRFTVRDDDNIRSALLKIDRNRHRFALLVNGTGQLSGVLTDGDVRRWLLSGSEANLNAPVVCAIGQQGYKAARDRDSSERIRTFFSDSIHFVPIVDGAGHLVAVARERFRNDQFALGPNILSETSSCFVIAEVGINHNGDPEIARKLIDAACDAGADCVKFQMRDLESLFRSGPAVTHEGEDLGAQYTLDLLSKFELAPAEMLKLFNYCAEQGAFALVTPWDLCSLEFLEHHRMQAYKVASADLTNHELLERLALTGKPLICSTGMATEREIIQSVDLLKRRGVQYALLHCNSTYPVPYKDINLRYIGKLKEIGECLVGYSGHERGWHIPIAAVAQGAKIIEKHITLDRNMEGNDHKVSLLPQEFKEMVRRIREVEDALGDFSPRVVTQGEMMNRNTLAKSVVAARVIQEGTAITEKDLQVRGPGCGLQPNRRAELLGRLARRTMAPGDFFFPSDLEVALNLARNYSFSRPWGLPVRYHDFASLLSKSNPDFLEFHLSYHDLELDPAKYFHEPFSDLGLVVHSPDLFPGDHLLNLADESASHRARSVQELQSVVDLTRRMKRWFPSSTRPLIVASLGGFTRDRLLNARERDEAYARLEESLELVDADGVELIAQTLPPFPWYFGGQLFLSLFMSAPDTKAFCLRTGLRLCFDTSHSKLACNHFKWSFREFVATLGPFVAHLHFGDARGVDGEGLQIGEGEIDFLDLTEQLARLCPNASFIPEIWQGHKNEGEGFWKALDLLEGYS